MTATATADLIRARVAIHPEGLADLVRMGVRRGADPAAADHNTRTIQAVIDALATHDGPRCILFPPWRVTVDRMLELCADRLEIRGRAGSELAMHGSRSDGLLYLGRMRRPRAPGTPPEGAAVDPADVIDLAPIGLPGRFGLRTYPNTIVDPDGPFAFADLADGFTVELLLDLAGGLPDYGPIGGILYNTWCLLCADGTLHVGLGVEGTGPEPPPEVFGFRAPLPAGRGWTLLSVQVDMPTAAGLILADDAVLFAGPIPGLAPGRRLVHNEQAPFHLGAQGRSAFAVGGQDIRSDEPRSRVFGGFHLLRGARYRPDGARLDGRARTFESSCFEVAGQTIGLLELRADHAALDADRRVEILTPGRGHAAYYLDAATGSPWNNIGGYRIGDVSLQGSGHYLGSTVVLPNVAHSGLHRCSIGGNRRAIAGWGASATYVLDVEDCGMIGADTTVYLNLAIVNFRGRNTIWHTGRFGLELIDCRTRIDQLFFNPSGTPRYLIRCRREGHLNELTACNVVSDWEQREAPTVAGFRLLGEGNYRLEAPRFGLMPPGSPLVWASTPADQPADVVLTQCNWAQDCGEVVRAEGPVLVECDAGTRDRAARRSTGGPLPEPPPPGA